MFQHKDYQLLPYAVADVYKIVADVEKYPEFIPWVSKVLVLSAHDNEIEYEVSVDFKVVKEKLTTLDTFYENEKIEIVSTGGPFKFLNTLWTFEKIEENLTKVGFEISFSFNSKLLEALFSKVFIVAQQKILNSFNQRAKDLLG
jgi:coenzyme Q-binding protein COQ10